MRKGQGAEGARKEGEVSQMEERIQEKRRRLMDQTMKKARYMREVVERNKRDLRQ